MTFAIVIGVWVALGTVLGFAVGPAHGLASTPIAFFHVPMAVAMDLGFLLAAWQGALWLRRKEPRHDAMSVAYAEAGAVFGLIATATGSIFSRANWGEYWSWDPQQVGIVAVLLTYGALFALRTATAEEDKQRDLWAVYAIFGGLAAIFWTRIFRHLPSVQSLHPPNTLFTSDARFRFALWFNVAGYTMLLVKLATLRARLEAVAQWVKDLEWA